MNLRRGLILAGVHVAIVIPLIISDLAPRWSMEKVHSQIVRQVFVLAAYREEEGTVEFVPICEEWRSISWQEKVLEASELPAAVLSGWNSDGPAAWTLSGLIGIDMRHHTPAKKLASSLGFCGLIALQWLLVGSFPLLRSRRWWFEPDAFNTLLSPLAVAFLLGGAVLETAQVLGREHVLPGIGVMAFSVLILLVLTWLAWIAALVWRTIRVCSAALADRRLT